MLYTVLWYTWCTYFENGGRFMTGIAIGDDVLQRHLESVFKEEEDGNA